MAKHEFHPRVKATFNLLANLLDIGKLPAHNYDQQNIESFKYVNCRTAQCVWGWADAMMYTAWKQTLATHYFNDYEYLMRSRLFDGFIPDVDEPTRKEAAAAIRAALAGEKQAWRGVARSRASSR